MDIALSEAGRALDLQRILVGTEYRWPPEIRVIARRQPPDVVVQAGHLVGRDVDISGLDPHVVAEGIG